MMIFTLNSTWVTFFPRTKKVAIATTDSAYNYSTTHVSFFFSLLSSCIATRVFDCEGTRNICKKLEGISVQGERHRRGYKLLSLFLSSASFSPRPVTDGRPRVLRSICSVSLKLLNYWVTPEGNNSCLAQRTPSAHSTLSYSPFHRSWTFDACFFFFFSFNHSFRLNRIHFHELLLFYYFLVTSFLFNLQWVDWWRREAGSSSGSRRKRKKDDSWEM